MAGVPSSSASTKGLPLLRLLLATAPPLDAPIIFLPQQRTMFLIQAIQKWIGSDDDLEEEILASVAELFLHLAPIVQELSGSHWELIFDVVESNLEVSRGSPPDRASLLTPDLHQTASWDEPITLPALYHSCRLLNLVKELASANSELKATARARIDKSLELVRDLFVSRPGEISSHSDHLWALSLTWSSWADSRARNQPRVVILEIMARLVRDLPPKLLEIGSSFNSVSLLIALPERRLTLLNSCSSFTFFATPHSPFSSRLTISSFASPRSTFRTSLSKSSWRRKILLPSRYPKNWWTYSAPDCPAMCFPSRRSTRP